MKNLAIIPARSGSKGLKDKNIKLLHGKHLLSYSVDNVFFSPRFGLMACGISVPWPGIEPRPQQ